MAAALGVDLRAAAELLPVIEAVMVRKLNEQMDGRAGVWLSNKTLAHAVLLNIVPPKLLKKCKCLRRKSCWKGEAGPFSECPTNRNTLVKFWEFG